MWGSQFKSQCLENFDRIEEIFNQVFDLFQNVKKITLQQEMNYCSGGYDVRCSAKELIYLWFIILLRGLIPVANLCTSER